MLIFLKSIFVVAGRLDYELKSRYVLCTIAVVLPRCQHHQNRFVREAAHLIVGVMCTTLQPPQQPQQTSSSMSSPMFDILVRTASATLADGLTDNWSQVGATEQSMKLYTGEIMHCT